MRGSSDGSSSSSMGYGSSHVGAGDLSLYDDSDSSRANQNRRVRMSIPSSQVSSSPGSQKGTPKPPATELSEVQQLKHQLQLERSKRETVEGQLMAARAGEIGGNADTQRKLADAQKKIRDLTDEVQRLLAEKVSMQTEISQLRFQLAGKTTSDLSPVSGRGGGDTFEISRQLAKAKADLHEQEREVVHLRDRVMGIQEENERLRQLIGEHNDQVAIAQINDSKKKKKTWWGGTKPSKRALSPAMIITDDAEDNGPPTISITPVPDGKKANPEATMMAHAANINKISHKWQEKVQVLNERILDLEREKARAEAENALLEKERRTLTDKTLKQDGVIDSLKAQQKLLQDPDRIQSTKSVMIALPPGGGTDADRWRTVVQVQEAALRKTAIQKEELQRQLDTIAIVHGPQLTAGAQHDSETIRSLQNELSVQSRTMAELKKDYAESQLMMHEARLKERYWMDEIHKYKTALKDLDELLRDKTRRQDKQHDAFVAMLGAALADNEVLFVHNAHQARQHNEDIKVLHGEARALRQGRVARMKGDAPTKAVFPSPETDMVVFRHREEHREERRKEPSTTTTTSSSASSSSSSRSSSSSDHHPKAIEEPIMAPDRKYFYEWIGGAYVLRHGQQAVNAQQETGAGSRSGSPPPGPFPQDPAVQPVDEQANEQRNERDRAAALTALRTWNALPPMPPQLPNPPLAAPRHHRTSISSDGRYGPLASRRAFPDRGRHPSHPREVKGKTVRSRATDGRARSQPVQEHSSTVARNEFKSIRTNYVFSSDTTKQVSPKVPLVPTLQPEIRQPIQITITEGSPETTSTSSSTPHSKFRSTTNYAGVSPSHVDNIPIYEVTEITYDGRARPAIDGNNQAKVGHSLPSKHPSIRVGQNGGTAAFSGLAKPMHHSTPTILETSNGPSAPDSIYMSQLETAKFPSLAESTSPSSYLSMKRSSGSPFRTNLVDPLESHEIPPIHFSDGHPPQRPSRPHMESGESIGGEIRRRQGMKLNKVLEDDEVENMLGALSNRRGSNRDELFGPRRAISAEKQPMSFAPGPKESSATSDRYRSSGDSSIGHRGRDLGSSDNKPTRLALDSDQSSAAYGGNSEARKLQVESSGRAKLVDDSFKRRQLQGDDDDE